MIKRVASELSEHAPFTAFGAVTGIVIIVAFVLADVSFSNAEPLFDTFHPVHVLFSALVTTALYKQHSRGKIWAVVLIGYTGSVGIATISDSIIPYVGELLMDLPHAEAHIGFIETWWLVNPLALLGIAIGYFRPATKFPHMGHVLLSTWASLFHIVMALEESFDLILMLPIFAFLFLAVIVPCCTSDIVYPLLFTRENRIHAH